MIVKELIEVLQRQDQDAVVVIGESSDAFGNNVLLLLTDDSNPDDAQEIRVE